MKSKLIVILAISFFSILIYVLISNSILYDKNSFGMEYNIERLEKNIPTLKKDWLINDKNALFEYYSPNSNQDGHLKKYINLSKSNVGSERDVFRVDSVVFYSLYERNNSNKVIYKLFNYHSLSEIFQSEKEVISSKTANELLKKTNENFRFDSSWDR